jgi:hypothetical protein
MIGTLEVTVTWFWLNIPPAVLFFLAWTLIPLRMVFRHPDTVPGVRARDEPRPTAQRRPWPVPLPLPASPRQPSLPICLTAVASKPSLAITSCRPTGSLTVPDPAAAPLLVQVAADPVGGPLPQRRTCAGKGGLSLRPPRRRGRHPRRLVLRQPGYAAFPARASKHHH